MQAQASLGPPSGKAVFIFLMRGVIICFETWAAVNLCYGCLYGVHGQHGEQLFRVD